MAFTEVEKNDLITKVDTMDKRLINLDKIIRGPDDAVESAGLRHSVMMNSKFRKILTTWLWLMTTIMTGIIVERAMTIFGGT